MMKKVLETLLVSLVVVVVAGLYFRFVGGIPFNVSQTSTSKMGTFDVNGTAIKSVAPDEAVVNLGVRKNARSVKEAQKDANTALTQLTAELKKIGIEEKNIKTANYSVNPEYSLDNYQKITGYVVYASVEVRVTEGDFDKVEQVMDLAGTLGLEQMNGLRFELSDKLQKQTKNEAREMAVKEAKEKAEVLAKLTGVRLGKIVNVNENFGGGVVPMYARAMSNKMEIGGAADMQTSVNPGTTDMQVTVTLSYETL
jgi:uncharacterized protein YggE